MIDMKEFEKFKEGIFSLKTRRFGTIAELMIQELYNLDNSNTLAFDKKTKKNNQRVEVKFSIAMEKAATPITNKTAILACKEAILTNRLISSTDSDKKFDFNIQQIKCKEFDILYYGIFFFDHIEIFKMSSAEVKNCPGYSNKQHRGNIGEGQFHINKKTIDYHRKNNLDLILSYEELYKLFKMHQ